LWLPVVVAEPVVNIATATKIKVVPVVVQEQPETDWPATVLITVIAEPAALKLLVVKEPLVMVHPPGNLVKVVALGAVAVGIPAAAAAAAGMAAAAAHIMAAAAAVPAM